MDEQAEYHVAPSDNQPGVGQTFLSAKLRRLAPIAAICLAILGAIGTFMMATARPAVPPRKQAIPAQPLDLKHYYHTPASSFRNGRFPWGEVTHGTQTFGNVPLIIDGAIYLWGAANAQRGMEFAEQVDDIPVDRQFETLYVYHGAFMSSPDGSPVYRLTMHYADGSSNETTICYGTHVRDWYEGPAGKTTLSDPKSQFVWRADHPGSTPERPIKLRFSITSIPNPKPSLEVKSISLASAKGNSAGCILAMTTGPADLLKAEPETKAATSEQKP